MRWFAVWRERIRALVFGAQQDAAMAEELDFHLEQEAELLRKTGLGPEEARRQAQLRFGAIERCKEEVRDARGIGRVEDIWKDLTFAVRGLWRRPGFSLGVALTLGLGIGATTTVYSVVDGVMFRPLPYRDPSALVAVGAVIPDTEWVDGATDLQNLGRMSGWHYRRFEERTRSFETLAHVQSRLLAVPVGEGFVATTAPAVSPELFETLGVSPVLGRTFLPEEYGATKLRPDGPPIEPAVLITHGAWQRRYGGDPAVVGQPLEGRGPIVVGVLPPSFHPLEAFEQRPPDFYLPQPWHDIESHSIGTMVRVVGRLKQGVSVDQARAEARRIAADLASEFPGDTVQPDGSRVGIGVNGLHSQTIGTTGRSLGLFLGAAGLLLLLATMNGATLLFSRSLDRTREFGVRMALGASRTRVVRLIVSEAALLAVAGGSCGVLLAYGGVGALLRYAPPSLSIPRLNDIAVDARVLAVAGAVSIGTGIAAGLLPALGLTRRGRWGRLHRTGRVFAEPTSRLRAVLVGGQMTLAIVLLSGAGLFLNSFVRLSSVDPGFEADGLITMREAYKDSALVSGRPQW